MEIKKEIIETQKKLSKFNCNFLEYVEKNPETLDRSNFKLLELNDRLFTLQPWPTFINSKTKNSFQEVGIKLFDLIKSIPKRVFDHDPQKIGRYFEIPSSVVEIQLDGYSEEQIKNLVARGDFFVTPHGLKCLEYNVSAHMGGVHVPLWESFYLKTPIINRFIHQYNVKILNQNLISKLLEQSIWQPLQNLSKGDEIDVAIVLERYVMHNKGNTMEQYLNKLYKELLQRIDTSLTGEVIICDYPHLKLKDNHVFLKGKKIKAMIELYHGLVPPTIMQVFKAGNLSITNGPISKLLSNKLMLAVLSDNESFDCFTEEEKKFITAHVPWTRKISPSGTTYGDEKIENLEKFILSNREKLVIKPPAGLGGEGIYIGRKSTEKQWEEAVDTAIKKKDWLVQELIEPAIGIYQTGDNNYAQQEMVWGIYIFGSNYAGSWVRVMPHEKSKGVINCHQGATVSIVFEVEE